MNTLRIIDKGLGWHVVGEWHGAERVIHRPTPVEALDPFRALASCMRFARANS